MNGAASQYYYGSLYWIHRSGGKYTSSDIYILHSVLPLLILDGEFAARRVLVLIADKVSNLLIFRLLDGRLVGLAALAKNMLLDVVDA